MPKVYDKRELGLAIADNGGWEEFHQKRGNFTMFDHHKSVRLKLEREYRERFSNDHTSNQERLREGQRHPLRRRRTP